MEKENAVIVVSTEDLMQVSEEVDGQTEENSRLSDNVIV